MHSLGFVMKEISGQHYTLKNLVELSLREIEREKTGRWTPMLLKESGEFFSFKVRIN